VVKAFGLLSTMAGVFLAGAHMKAKGIMSTLWLFGWLQLVNAACLAALWILPASMPYLAILISLDHLMVGGASLAFVTFLAGQTKRNYTATQYAILTSLMALPAGLLSSPSGYLAAHLGWPLFYLLGGILVLPGLWLLKALRDRGLCPIEPEGQENGAKANP
jgi:PAT family beta-lactamase induction signal transducer AmpG